MKQIRISIICKILGSFLVIESMAMLVCALIALYYQESHVPFIKSFLYTALIGLFLFAIFRKESISFTKKEGYLIIPLVWIIVSIFGSLPFIFSVKGISLTDSFFEAISGFTTTGATIFSDVGLLDKSILLWRSLSQWIGGLGFILLSLALIPLFGMSSLQQFSLEIPEFGKEKLYIKIKDLALRIILIYISLTLLQAILLFAGDFSFFHSVNFALSTISTGGFKSMNIDFSTLSNYMQFVFIASMFVAGINFILTFILFQRKFKVVLLNEEFQSYVAIILTNTVIIAFVLWIHKIGIYEHMSIFNIIKTTLFQVVSIVSTTGYAIDNFTHWPLIAIAMLLMLYVIGGSFGSASGGIKNIRLVVLAKYALLEFKRSLHPNAIIPVRLQGKSIEKEIIIKVFLFTIIYILVFIFGVIVMSILGNSFETSLGTVAATLNNVGPGFGEIGPNDTYSMLSIYSKWFLSGLMLCGRLEIFTLIMIFSPTFWRK